MVEKFPKHPDMVLGKMKKFLEKEERRAEELIKEVGKVRAVLGVQGESEGESPFQGRKLQALSYASARQRCPEYPPGLLGPLIVQTEADPDDPEPREGDRDR